MVDIYLLAIVMHAGSAIAAFVVGGVCVFQRALSARRSLAGAHLVLLVLMETFLCIAILWHRASLAFVTQLVFVGLALLGMFMIWRAVQAVLVVRDQPNNQVALIDHIGFNLISLFDGFAVVSAIDLHVVGWIVAIVAVGAVWLGIVGLNRRKRIVAARMV